VYCSVAEEKEKRCTVVYQRRRRMDVLQCSRGEGEGVYCSVSEEKKKGVVVVYQRCRRRGVL